MEQAAPTLQFPNFHIEDPGRYRQQPTGGNRYHRVLPLSPSREASNSSDDSQRSPAADAYAEDDGSESETSKRRRTRVFADRWLPEEDELLTQAVRTWEANTTGGLCPWRTIAASIGGHHTAAQCAQRWRRVLRPELKKGPWVVEQEERLIRLVLELGPMWAKVSTKMGDRSDIQCRYWFRKLRQMGAEHWSAADDVLLRQLHQQHGNDWRTIAKKLETLSRRRAHTPSACLARVLLVHPSLQ